MVREGTLRFGLAGGIAYSREHEYGDPTYLQATLFLFARWR